MSDASNNAIGWGLLHSASENVHQRKRILRLRGLCKLLADTEPRETPSVPDREPKTRAAEAIEPYRTGISTTQVARRLGFSRTTIAAWIKAAGITIRHSPISDAEFAEARLLRNQRLSYERIGQLIGYSASGVRLRLVEIGE